MVLRGVWRIPVANGVRFEFSRRWQRGGDRHDGKKEACCGDLHFGGIGADLYGNREMI